MTKIPRLKLPGTNGAISQGEFFIRHNQIGVDFKLKTQTGTSQTSTVRSIKAEGSGSNFTQANPAGDTGEMLREK